LRIGAGFQLHQSPASSLNNRFEILGLKFMLVLGIETSTPICSVALSDDKRVMVHYTLDKGVHHSERLLMMIQQVLSDAGAGFDDIDGIAVASGPGSFTGLRIGMGTAKGLCMATNKPLVCVPTLSGMALVSGVEGLPVCAMLDARRNEVYAGVYEVIDGLSIEQMADRADFIDKWLAILPRPVVLTGEGAWVYRTQLVEGLGHDALFASRSLGRPDGGAIALIGASRVVKGMVDDVDAAEPKYLRRSQAERVREARLDMIGAGKDG
jgi:tRNA threonylcarbamoyladenosine biosynthesis protein TsaB